jgi:hypothetical protein
MSLNELERWRKKVPWYIFTACVVPWFFVKFKNGEQFKLYYDTLVPLIATVLGFFYVGLNLRGILWEFEMETYVRGQIRSAIINLVPKDLEVMEDEKQRLLEREIYKKLAGVFWGTVDGDATLSAHKQHFYSNGIVYSTSFDVFLICYPAAIFFYCGAALATGLFDFVYVAAILFTIAIVSLSFVAPRCRAVHLELSREQLELIRQQHSAAVAEKFRTIIIGWRSQNTSGGS